MFSTGTNKALGASALSLALVGGAAAAGTAPSAHAAGEQTRHGVMTTAYTWQDNDRSGSRGDDIASPTVHKRAGGVGSYEDPITVAVGKHGDKYDYAPGTCIYIPSLKKYFVAEDLCGACSKQSPGMKIDMWIDGRTGTANGSDACANALTQKRDIVVNPAKGKAVDTTPLFNGKVCHK